MVDQSGIMDAPLAGRLEIHSLAGVPHKKQRFMLTGVPLPRGGASVVAGVQGTGKSLLFAHWAARLTNDGQAVAFVADEDPAEITLVPRLLAAGADVALVYRVRPSDRFESVTLPGDTEEVAALVADRNVRVLFLDPWTSHVGGDHDKGSNVRPVLMAIARLCEETGLTVPISAHPIKAYLDAGDPLLSIAHAGAVSQVARGGVFMTLDPDTGSPVDPGRNTGRLLHHIKGGVLQPSRRYTIDTVTLTTSDGEPDDVPRFIPGNLSELRFHDVAERLRAARQAARRPTAKADAKAWLRDRLGDGEAQPRADVIEAGEDAGHSERSLKRAFHDLDGVSKSIKAAGKGARAGATWRLPSAEQKGELA